MRRKPMVIYMTAISFPEAMTKGLIKPRAQRPEEIAAMINFVEPKAQIYGLRFPEKDAKTERDFMRISFKEEDAVFLEELKLKTITTKEQKKLPREILTDNWAEDMSLYKNKRKP
jgi:hypothetical protein